IPKPIVDKARLQAGRDYLDVAYLNGVIVLKPVDLEERIPPEAYERFIKEVPDLIANWPATGRLYLERKTNTLFVRATPAAITELRRQLRAMDYQSAQIMIEARFVEVREESMRELGLDWGGGSLGDRASISDGANGALAPTGITGAGAAGPATLGGGGLLAQVLFTPKGSGSPGIFGRIQALEKESKAESLTEPRILTVNNAVGMIKLAETTSYVTGYTYNGTTTGTTTTNNGTTNVQSSNATPNWETVETGITLRIRPSITRNSDIITLDIRPSISVIKPPAANNSVKTQYSPNSTTTSDVTSTKLDTITRALSTTMHVQNGQTVVLGGQALDFIEDTDSGVPGLRSIPVFGRLFSKSGKSVKRSNLLIFVTAHIIDPSGAKVGEEIQRLKDTAHVIMPEELRAAEAENQLVEQQRRDAAVKQEKDVQERSQSPTTKSGKR
ncbi:MAG: hypothetical protein AAB263_11040, partial [Planctomycetota bacterium]